MCVWNRLRFLHDSWPLTGCVWVLPSGSWWHKGRAFQSPERRTWRCSIPELSTGPSPQPLPAPHRLWTRTAAPPSRRSLCWSTKHPQGLNSQWFRAMSFTFLLGNVFDSQDNMEGASQCCLAEVALCPHSQYIRDLSEGWGSEMHSVYSMWEYEACFSHSPPAIGWPRLPGRWWPRPPTAGCPHMSHSSPEAWREQVHSLTFTQQLWDKAPVFF